MSLEMVESGGEGQRRVRGKELVSGEEEGEEGVHRLEFGCEW